MKNSMSKQSWSFGSEEDVPIEIDKHIYKYVDGYYFWDESDCQRYGPFDVKEEAEKALDEYCKHIGG